jgi:hypothetical protein
LDKLDTELPGTIGLDLAMKSQNANLRVLIFLSFLWFVTGMGAAVVFAFALNMYGNAGDKTTLMMVSLASLIAFPMVCVQTLVLGWRRFIAGSYPSIIKIVLLPFPVLVLVVFLFELAWP